jgi:hypothetical protein
LSYFSDEFIKLLKAIAIIIIIIIAAFAIISFTGNSGAPQEPPNLQVTLQTLAGKAGASPTLNFKVENTGGNAREVVITASSSAFSQASTNKFDIQAGQTVDASCTVKVNDVEIADYPVTLTYTYKDGATETVTDNPTFHVLPAIEFVNQHWHWPTFALSEKSHIGTNDETTLYFKIKSSSGLTYNGFSMNVTAPAGTVGLEITPNAGNLDPTGPQGTSSECAIKFKSTNTPPGVYTINIKAYSENYEVAALQVTLWVDG